MNPRNLSGKSEDFSRQLERTENDGEGGTEGSGGQTGEIHFRYRDAMSVDPRDDALPVALREALAHGHLDRVNRQKQKRAQMRELRENPQKRVARMPGYSQSGGGSGSNSPHASHPLLGTKAQFAGISPEVSPLAVDAEGKQNTNAENRQKLEARPVPGLRQRQQLRNERKFNPRPTLLVNDKAAQL